MSRNEHTFRANNKAAVKHGGEAAVKAITAGTELTGPAALAEAQVYEQLAQAGGRASLVTQNAARLQAAADLYWRALIEAGESGDLKALDRYVARFGWLASSSLRAWAQVKDEQKDAPDALDYERILQEQNKDG